MISRRLFAHLLPLLLASAGASSAQSLCNSFHVPPGHIGNIEGCVFGGNNTTTISFNAPAILQWERGFRINPDQHLRFQFPDGLQGAAVLNRDLSGLQSNISGMVSSNGRVLLINPGGNIVMQSTGIIDADGGFLASTLDTKHDEALLRGEGGLFQGDGLTRFTNNGGTINSSRGDITIISGSINNRDQGAITAPLGGIFMGAGTQIRLSSFGERIQVLSGPENHVISNNGTIEAANAIELRVFNAKPGDPKVRNAFIENSGIIRTTSKDGRIFLTTSNGGQILNNPGATIESLQPISIQGQFTNEGALIEPDDGSNPGAPSGTRQFPRLTTGTLTQTPNSDFRLTRLSFSHLNGLESKTGKKTKGKKVVATKKASTDTIVRGATTSNPKKKPAPKKKVVIRRGTFFGKKTG